MPSRLTGLCREIVLLLVGCWLISASGLEPVVGPTEFADDDAFLEYVQRQTFNYFWQEVNPENGLIRDRSTPASHCSIAAVGFGLSAINIAVERDWISREAGASRALLTLKTFAALPQGPGTNGYAGYRGWYYHFLDMKTGQRAWRSELSTIDTALLMMGVIDSGLFFDGPSLSEKEIRRLAALLFDRIDWGFMLRTNDLRVSMEWRPERGFSRTGWEGYNEANCLYLLGIGAEKDPLPAESWGGWTAAYRWTNYYGYGFAECPPLFTHHYSHCWIDFRGIADPWMRARRLDYFENSRRATLAQREYAIRNPLRFPNYSSKEWGLTACDGPGTTVGGVRYEAYSARGAPGGFDDGTIAPTAAIASLPFAPEVCLPALRHFYSHYGTNLWTNLGFRDAYNVKAGWWGPDAIGIDQGPIILMIENYRTGAVWKRMRRSPVLQRGLQRADFR